MAYHADLTAWETQQATWKGIHFLYGMTQADVFDNPPSGDLKKLSRRNLVKLLHYWSRAL